MRYYNFINSQNHRIDCRWFELMCLSDYISHAAEFVE